MRALVIGAGNTGCRLAHKLCEENYDVVVVDEDVDALTELEASLDVMTIQGHGSNPNVLRNAQLEKADVLAGVTNNDDTNILAGIQAKRAGVQYVIARVSNSSFMEPQNYSDLKAMGIDLAVDPHAQCARDIYDILKLPGILEAVGLLSNRIMAVGIEIPETSPLIGTPLRDLSNKEIVDRVRFIARIRDEELEIPFGDASFESGDKIYVVGSRYDINSFLLWCCPHTSRVEKVVIASKYGTGLELARMMEADTDVFLVEPDADCAEKCSSLLNKTVVMHGNMLSQEIYQEINFTDKTAFVATSKSDEDNIIACLLASKRSTILTTAFIKEPEYVSVVDSLDSIDRTVSTHISLINSILQFIRGDHVLAAAELHGAAGELLEIIIEQGSRWVGKKIAEIKMPKDSIIATVLRGDTIHPAIGSLDLQAGDRLAIFSTQKSLKKLHSICHG
jgi:trk system potassium uptake protein TrkA